MMLISRITSPSLPRTAALTSLAAAFISAGCFASKSDFEKLQADMLTARVSSNVVDSLQRAELVEVSRSVRALNDSISALSRRMAAMRTASDAELTAIKEDISQLQDISGQSEQKMRELRASVEEKTRAQETGTADSSGAGSVAAPVDNSGPGPAQLLQAGRDQLLKGGNTAARAAFSELIAKYPRSELVPEAMFYTAQAYAAERKNDEADSVYASLISKYPNSPRVPTAMYKRALQLQATKKTAEARRMFQDIIKRYPRSDEAALADERLQSLR